jgi:hypothetical protein
VAAAYCRAARLHQFTGQFTFITSDPAQAVDKKLPLGIKRRCSRHFVPITATALWARSTARRYAQRAIFEAFAINEHKSPRTDRFRRTAPKVTRKPATNKNRPAVIGMKADTITTSRKSLHPQIDHIHLKTSPKNTKAPAVKSGRSVSTLKR